MILEEQIEDFFVEKIKALQLGFKAVQLLEGMPSEISDDNMQQYTSICPAALVGTFENSPIKNIDADATVQMMEFDLRVVVIETNLFRKNKAHSAAKAKLRGVRNALRGLQMENGDGKFNIRYAGQSVILPLDTIVFYEQRWLIHTMERNDLGGLNLP